MTDVRSLLRAERQNRRITHPHASYTADGKLLCNLCETRIKTESAWQAHLHSSQHTLRTSKSNGAAETRGVADTSKKRKAVDLDSPPAERKKAKPGLQENGRNEPSEDTDQNLSEPSDVATAANESPSIDEAGDARKAHDAREGEVENADGQELEAFERELATLEASMAPTKAFNTAATISAAPMTAEQVAAQAREDQSTQRGRRDAEIEDEREEAARLLEDEFEEMEGLEARVKKLRERREALRKGTLSTSDKEQPPDPDENANPQPAYQAAEAKEPEERADDDEDDEEDEDYDDWKFGT